MITTYQYNSVLMEKYYLVHAYINNYVWFDTYDQAYEFLFSKWIDRRFANDVICPVK